MGAEQSAAFEDEMYYACERVKRPLSQFCSTLHPQSVTLTRKNVIKGRSCQEQADKKRHDIAHKLGSALHTAASYGDQQQIRHLVKDGAKINSRDEEGRTPFMLACKYGMLQTARMLIKLSANSDLVDKNNKTALDHTTHNHVKEWLIRYLRSRRLSESGDMEIHNYHERMQATADRSASSFSATSSSFTPSNSGSVSDVSSEGKKNMKSWKTVKERFRSGALTSAHRPSRSSRAGCTMHESLKKIKVEGGDRFAQADASQIAAEVSHRVVDLDIQLGTDLTTRLVSSMNRSESTPRKPASRK